MQEANHCVGMGLATLCCVAHGSTRFSALAEFCAAGAMGSTEPEHRTVLHGVPTMFIAARDCPGWQGADMRMGEQMARQLVAAEKE